MLMQVGINLSACIQSINGIKQNYGTKQFTKTQKSQLIILLLVAIYVKRTK